MRYIRNDVRRYGVDLVCAMLSSLSPIDRIQIEQQYKQQLCALTNVQAFDRHFKYFICLRLNSAVRMDDNGVQILEIKCE